LDNFWIYVGNNWETARDKMSYFLTRYNYAILILLGLVVVCVLVKMMMKKSKSKR